MVRTISAKDLIFPNIKNKLEKLLHFSCAKGTLY